MTTKIKAGHEVKVGAYPDCDLCKAAGAARYDGKTVFGPWAYQCSTCFAMYGVGTGVGRGQRLILAVKA